ncbi:glycosyltransferase family 2 protein [Candidatus Microgenomates bacterium]|nr:glycosyltransferase family 2 protein [Candidatus Microgenomates bacterium]
MIQISAILLTKNGEDLIADCLDSVSFCDEIIVIDDKSTDRTVDIATHLGAKVISYDAPSFAEKRNFGLKKAKGKWVLYIDVDERISQELQGSILHVVDGRHSGKRSASRISYDSTDVSDSGQARMTNDIVAYRFQRKNFYFGNHQWPTLELLPRLFLKSSLQEWYGDVHETPIVRGETDDLDGYLLHYTHRDLTSMVAKTIMWSEVEARLRFNANHPRMSWWRFPRVMTTAFVDSYVKQKGYKAGTVGLIESMYQAFSMFITYARLWEMQQNSTKK